MDAIIGIENQIRRTVTIPKKVGNEDVLAIIEVGAKLWNKHIIYKMFFESAVSDVKKQIIEEIKKRGGDEKNYEKAIKDAQKNLTE